MSRQDDDLALAAIDHAIAQATPAGRRKRGGPELTLTFESIQTNPAYPNPVTEAEHLAVLVRNGEDLDGLRRLIGITPEQAAWLTTITAGDPLRSRTVKRAIAFRRKVLAAFEDVIAKRANTQKGTSDGD